MRRPAIVTDPVDLTSVGVKIGSAGWCVDLFDLGARAWRDFAGVSAGVGAVASSAAIRIIMAADVAAAARAGKPYRLPALERLSSSGGFCELLQRSVGIAILAPNREERAGPLPHLFRCVAPFPQAAFVKLEMLVGIEIEGFELLVHLAVAAVDEIAVPQMEEVAGNHADAALHQVARLEAPRDEMSRHNAAGDRSPA